MSPQYSLVYLTTGCCSPAEMIEIAAETGYDCIEARTIPMGIPGEKPFDLAQDRRLFLDTKYAMEKTGVRIDAIENATIQDGKDVGRYEACLEAAADLGVRRILSNIWSPDMPFVEEQFGRLCEMASQYGQSVDLEFVTWAQVTNIEEAEQLIRAAGSRNAGILVDTLHFHRSRVPWEDLANMPDERAYCLHICDAPDGYPQDTQQLAYTAREGRLYPGEGCIDIRRIASMKKWSVYGIEIPNTAYWDAKGYRKHAADALLRTKEYLKDPGKRKEKT